MYNDRESHYAKYLTEERNLTNGSYQIYLQALNKVSSILKDHGMIKDTIFEINSLSVLSNTIHEALNMDEITEYDKVWHCNRSLALRHYHDFAYSHKQLFSNSSTIKVRRLAQ